MIDDLRPPYRVAFDNARDPYSARNALGITSIAGGGGIAPANAQYITAASDATLTAERVATNTATVTWDFATAGQAKANVVAGSFGDVYLAAANVFTNTNTFQGGGTTIQGLTGNNASLTMQAFQNANGNPNLTIQHSRGTTLGAHAAVIAADRLGQISFMGSDGAAFALGAIIQAFSEAVPTSGHVATNLRFSTDNGTASAERVRIWASGGVDFDQSAAADPGAGNIKVKGIKGLADGSSAAAGYVGEYIESNVASGSAIALTTAVAANITSISLTAGDWDVQGHGVCTGHPTTQVTLLGCSVSATSATLDTTSGRFPTVLGFTGTVFGTTSTIHLISGVIRVSLTSTTTIYLVGYAAFTTNTCSAYGRITARRVR